MHSHIELSVRMCTLQKNNTSRSKIIENNNRITMQILTIVS